MSDEIEFAKDPAIAVLLSVFLPGLGQVYVGNYFAGLFLAVSFLIASALWWTIVLGVVAGLIWVYGLFSAHAAARRHNRRIEARR